MVRSRVAKRATGAALFSILISVLSGQPQKTDMLWHHRNLGKAFYENPTTQKEAVEQFKEALDMDPNS
ncbi:MAG: hypothetical protein WA324_10440, partial [Bryobacteraceae bacterium]